MKRRHPGTPVKVHWIMPRGTRDRIKRLAAKRGEHLGRFLTVLADHYAECSGMLE